MAGTADVNGSRLDGDVTVVVARDGGRAASLLRGEVGQLIGIPAQDVRLSRSCPQCGSSDHGTPVVLPNDAAEVPFVSLSRAGRVVMIALSRHGPVGVDVERLDALRFAGFDDVALHPHEIAPTIEARAATWVRKESLLKATGDALHVDPRLVRLSDPDLPPELLGWSAPNPPDTGVWMRDLDIEDHAACVTVLSQVAPRITLRRAVPEGLPG